MNRCVLVGRLTKDPELRHTSNEIAVCSFTIAINRPFGENEADFINCQSWRKQAENLAKYMGKGMLIGVDGRIQTRTYDDDQGNKRFITEVVADNIQYLESKKEGKTPQDFQPEPKSKPDVNKVTEDDLPF